MADLNVTFFEPPTQLNMTLTSSVSMIFLKRNRKKIKSFSSLNQFRWIIFPINFDKSTKSVFTQHWPTDVTGFGTLNPLRNGADGTA